MDLENYKAELIKLTEQAYLEAIILWDAGKHYDSVNVEHVARGLITATNALALVEKGEVIRFEKGHIKELCNQDNLSSLG